MNNYKSNVNISVLFYMQGFIILFKILEVLLMKITFGFLFHLYLCLLNSATFLQNCHHQEYTVHALLNLYTLRINIT